MTFQVHFSLFISHPPKEHRIKEGRLSQIPWKRWGYRPINESVGWALWGARQASKCNWV